MVARAEMRPRYAGRKVSVVEYRQLAEDGFRYDHIDGTVQSSPSPHFPHSQAQAALITALQRFVRPRALGLVLPELDVFLPDEGDVLRPDVSVILRERRPIVRECIYGAPEYWLIDPDERRLELRENRGKAWLARGGLAITSRVIEGLTLSACDLFLES